MNQQTHLNKFVFLFLALLTFQIAAQEGPKDQLFLLHQDVIKIDKVAEYEKISAELFDLFKEHGMEGTVKYASKTDDNKYNFYTPLSSYADLDNRAKYWANLGEKAGDALTDILARMDETYVHHKDYLLRHSADLSYWPENNRLKGEKRDFIHFDHYYFKDGKLSEGLKMMKEFKDLMIAKKSNDGYSVWIFDIGGEYGHIMVTRLAKDGVDYYQETERRMALMSEELKEMWPKFSSLLKHFEHSNGSLMPQFVYKPEK